MINYDHVNWNVCGHVHLDMIFIDRLFFRKEVVNFLRLFIIVDKNKWIIWRSPIQHEHTIFLQKKKMNILFDSSIINLANSL